MSAAKHASDEPQVVLIDGRLYGLGDTRQQAVTDFRAQIAGGPPSMRASMAARASVIPVSADHASEVAEMRDAVSIAWSDTACQDTASTDEEHEEARFSTSTTAPAVKAGRARTTALATTDARSAGHHAARPGARTPEPGQVPAEPPLKPGGYDARSRPFTHNPHPDLNGWQSGAPLPRPHAWLHLAGRQLGAAGRRSQRPGGAGPHRRRLAAERLHCRHRNAGLLAHLDRPTRSRGAPHTLTPPLQLESLGASDG